MQTECELAADPQAPAVARSFAMRTLETMLARPVPPNFYDDVQLVVSELVTNAVRAGSSRIGVSVGVESRRVVVRVSDEAQGWPRERQTELADPGGRGLPLVKALSADWGVLAGEGDAGKVVWAELAVPVA